MSTATWTVDKVFEDFVKRRSALVKALTTEADKFYNECKPDKPNQCLYGLPSGEWVVSLPCQEVPPEMPDPAVGINFARDGMRREDWLALVAVHSDVWLMSVVTYYSAAFSKDDRLRVFKLCNNIPTLKELVMGVKVESKPKKAQKISSKSPPPGKVLKLHMITPDIRGREAHLYWPDDDQWYLVEIQALNMRNRQAKILYKTGEVEDLDLTDICKDGHMVLAD
mmetsp:Transcript_10906/g.40023  ORF Transcript_10906/g.40023 Transcript_10906/m.40023 type:complete len:224 (-) Transcript_10906:2386-3057(-)